MGETANLIMGTITEGKPRAKEKIYHFEKTSCNRDNKSGGLNASDYQSCTRQALPEVLKASMAPMMWSWKDQKIPKDLTCKVGKVKSPTTRATVGVPFSCSFHGKEVIKEGAGYLIYKKNGRLLNAHFDNKGLQTLRKEVTKEKRDTSSMENPEVGPLNIKKEQIPGILSKALGENKFKILRSDYEVLGYCSKSSSSEQCLVNIPVYEINIKLPTGSLEVITISGVDGKILLREPLRR